MKKKGYIFGSVVWKCVQTFSIFSFTKKQTFLAMSQIRVSMYKKGKIVK